LFTTSLIEIHSKLARSAAGSDSAFDCACTVVQISQSMNALSSKVNRAQQGLGTAQLFKII
jgi:hypothetical protein